MTRGLIADSLVSLLKRSVVNWESIGRRGYFWPYVEDTEHPYIAYDFTTHHGRAGLQTFLGPYVVRRCVILSSMQLLEWLPRNDNYVFHPDLIAGMLSDLA